MILLAVSTQGAVGSLTVAELDDFKVKRQAHVTWQKKAMHSELATVKLQEALDQLGVQLNQLTHIAVNVGPGSFTGIRVGMNLARALAYALGLPILMLNALELAAHRDLQEGQSALVAQKAIQNFFYAAAYEKTADGLVERLSPRSFSDEELKAHTSAFTKVLIDQAVDAGDLVQWLVDWPKSRRFFSWKDVKPLYIRGSEAEEKLRKGILKPL